MVPYLSSSIIRRPHGILIWSNSICEWQSQNRGGTPLSPDSHGNHPFLRSLRSVIAKPSTLVSWCSWNMSVTTVVYRIESILRMQIMNWKSSATCSATNSHFVLGLWIKETINYNIKKQTILNLKSCLISLTIKGIIIEWMEISIDPWIEFTAI